MTIFFRNIALTLFYRFFLDPGNQINTFQCMSVSKTKVFTAINRFPIDLPNSIRLTPVIYNKGRIAIGLSSPPKSSSSSSLTGSYSP
jgi:hypothetical protein